MNVKRREDIEKAIEDCQRSLHTEEVNTSNDRHIKEIQLLRDTIDDEKKKRNKIDDFFLSRDTFKNSSRRC